MFAFWFRTPATPYAEIRVVATNREEAFRLLGTVVERPYGWYLHGQAALDRADDATLKAALLRA